MRRQNQCTRIDTRTLWFALMTDPQAIFAVRPRPRCGHYASRVAAYPGDVALSRRTCPAAVTRSASRPPPATCATSTAWTRRSSATMTCRACWSKPTRMARARWTRRPLRSSWRQWTRPLRRLRTTLSPRRRASRRQTPPKTRTISSRPPTAATAAATATICSEAWYDRVRPQARVRLSRRGTAPRADANVYQETSADAPAGAGEPDRAVPGFGEVGESSSVLTAARAEQRARAEKADEEERKLKRERRERAEEVRAPREAPRSHRRRRPAAALRRALTDPRLRPRAGAGPVPGAPLERPA